MIDERRSPLPDLKTLTVGLTSVLLGCRPAGREVAVVAREPNPYTGASRSEIVTCHLGDGRETRVFCKYEVPDAHSAVAYEAQVYRQVLQPLGKSTPSFYGSYTEAEAGRTWLVLEHVEGAVMLDEQEDPAAIAAAARWLGRFHAACEQHFSMTPPPFLKVYDIDYYLDRGRRALRDAEGSTEDISWLGTFCDRFEDFAVALPGRRATVAHGDYYVHNILLRDEAVCPIDWELAGLDLGEMDLACLTDGSPPNVEQECEQEYRMARWPQGAPEDFELTMAAARLCLFVFNLDRPDWLSDPQCRWYGRRLRSLAGRYGLLEAGR